MKSIVTEYTDVCFFCGRPAEGEHHLIFGSAGRELSEKDGLKVPVCNNCHNMGQVSMRIHDNPMAEKLSKMLGQAIWEKEQILQKEAETAKDLAYEFGKVDFNIGGEKRKAAQTAREGFRKRYGKSYL